MNLCTLALQTDLSICGAPPLLHPPKNFILKGSVQRFPPRRLKLSSLQPSQVSPVPGLDLHVFAKDFKSRDAQRPPHQKKHPDRYFSHCELPAPLQSRVHRSRTTKDGCWRIQEVRSRTYLYPTACKLAYEPCSQPNLTPQLGCYSLFISPHQEHPHGVIFPEVSTGVGLL